jgi:hypothetical protein
MGSFILAGRIKGSKEAGRKGAGKGKGADNLKVCPYER